MDQHTAAFVGAAISTVGWNGLRHGWNARVGFRGQQTEASPAALSSPAEVLREALEEACCWGPLNPSHAINVVLVGMRGADTLGLPVAGTFEGPEALSSGLRLAHRLALQPELDVVAVLCGSADGSQSVAFALRRFRDAWRAELRCLARLRPTPQGTLPRIGMQLALGQPHPLAVENGSCWLNAAETNDGAAQGEFLLELILSLHDRIFPPTAQQATLQAPFFSLSQARPWYHGNELRPRRALLQSDAASLILEEPAEHEFGDGPCRRRRLADGWPHEVFLLSADSREGLLAEIESLSKSAPTYEHLSDLACAAAVRTQISPGSHRLAIVATNRQSLLKSLDTASQRLSVPDCGKFALASGVFYEAGATSPPKLAMVFPGQGAQYPNMALDLCLAMPALQLWFDRFDEESDPRFPPPSEFLFPIPNSHRQADAHQLLMGEEGAEGSAVCAIGLNEVWESLGVKPDVIAGYSIGELSALISARVFLLRRGDMVRLMSELTRERTPHKVSQYPSFAVTTDNRDLLNKVIEEGQGEIFLALDSCPNQAIISGRPEPMKAAEKKLRESGATVFPLRFDRGYHTPLYAHKAARIRQLYEQVPVGAGSAPVFSCISLDWFPKDPDAVRDLAASQWTNPVRFREAAYRLHDMGISTFLEVGPGSRLTGFLRDSLRGRSFKALASDAQDRSGLRQFLHSFAQLFVAGVPVDARPLFATREVVWPNIAPAPIAEAPVALADQPTQGADDPIMSLLHGHMGLMEEFLAQQSRVHDMLHGRAPSDLPPTESPPAQRGEFLPRTAAARSHLGVPLESDEHSARWHLSFTLENLPLLGHHTLGGRPSEHDASLTPLPVLPFAYAVELMTQAAAWFAGQTPSEMQEIRGLRWLAVDGASLEVELRLCRADSGLLELEMLERRETELFPAYTARALVGSPPSPVPDPLPLEIEKESDFKVSGATFYSFIFHGPGFRGIRELTGIGQEAAVSNFFLPVGTRMLPPGVDPKFLSNPVMQDCSGQLVGVWLLEVHNLIDFGLYPYRLGRLQLLDTPAQAGDQVLCRARIQRDGRRTKASFELYQGGRLFARIEDFESRLFHFSKDIFRTIFALDYSVFVSRERVLEDGARASVIEGLSQELFDNSWGIWRRVLAHVTLSATERQLWLEVPPEQATSWLMRRLAVKDALRRWAQQHDVWLLPADVDCGLDGITPSGQILELLSPTPRLAVVGEGTFAVAIIAQRELGMALTRTDPEQAARLAAADLDGTTGDPWEVSRGGSAKTGFRLTRAGQELQVRCLQAGPYLVAWCSAEEALRERGESDETRPPGDPEGSVRDRQRDDRRLGSRA